MYFKVDPSNPNSNTNIYGQTRQQADKSLSSMKSIFTKMKNCDNASKYMDDGVICLSEISDYISLYHTDENLKLAKEATGFDENQLKSISDKVIEYKKESKFDWSTVWQKLGAALGVKRDEGAAYFSQGKDYSVGGYIDDASNLSELTNVKVAGGAIFKAIDGAGTDEKTVRETLMSLTPDEIEQLKITYKENYGEELKAAIDGDYSGDDKELLDAYLENKGAGYNKSNFNATDIAKQIFKAVDGWGTDETTISNIMTTLSPEQYKEVNDEYKALYNTDLKSAIDDDYSGEAQKILDAIMDKNLK